MKKLLIGIAAGVVSVSAFAQGQASMNTQATDAFAKFTNTTVANTFFFGPSQIYVGLYWALDQATLQAGGGTLATQGTTNSLGVAWLTGTTPTSGGFVDGPRGGGNRTIVDAGGNNLGGQTVFFQLRAWSQKDSLGNSLLTYAAALASGDPSVLVTHTSGVGAAPIDGGLLGNLPTSQPFQPRWNPGSSTAAGAIAIGLYPVPEPTTIALVGLGLLGLIFIRRRK